MHFHDFIASPHPFLARVWVPRISSESLSETPPGGFTPWQP